MKRTIILGVVACALILFVAAYAWKSSHLARSSNAQKPWNSHAIETSFEGVRVREVDPSHAAVDFLFDLDNHTGGDFQLTPGSGTVIMKRLKNDGSLSADKQARLVATAFVPTNNRTRIAIEVTDPFNWPARRDATADQAFRGLVTREASGIEGFVIFDHASRYQIELPVNLSTATANSQVSDNKGH